MGYEARCRLTLDGRRFEGKATLEQRDLVFRGGTRVAIPLQSLDAVAARDGRLSLTFAGRTAVFDLGPAASRWAERISNPPSRAR